jgi:cell division protease FtsH
MNTTAKTILIWVLILVAGVGLYNFVERGSGSGTRNLNLTDFLNKVDQGEVADVVVSGSNLRGHLSNGEAFRSTMPANYATVLDRLTERRVQVTVVPPTGSPWWGAASFSLPNIVVVTGAVLWLAISAVILVLVVDLSRFVKQQLRRNGGNHSTT